MADPPDRPPGAAAPTPAATVVPLRDGENGLEILLLQRTDRGVFGGMWVFPGGQVDQVDTPVGSGSGSDVELAAAGRAAVREAHEEAGLVLAAEGLVPLSFWLPPPEAPRRFATWFFLAATRPGAAVVVNDDEIRDHRWLTPAAAMARRDAHAIELAPPTYTTLWWLAQRPGVAEALADARARRPERFLTRVAVNSDGHMRVTLWEGDAGYADADLSRPGPRRRLWLDPNGWRIDITV
jgi:8-oxo-dGTP pyrophosphatase MutT (NUDIX family)